MPSPNGKDLYRLKIAAQKAELVEIVLTSLEEIAVSIEENRAQFDQVTDASALILEKLVALPTGSHLKHRFLGDGETIDFLFEGTLDDVYVDGIDVEGAYEVIEDGVRFVGFVPRYGAQIKIKAYL